ncbi:pyrimidine 5'-nucleotidase [Edhazardia aedis USNM 41457]|uniref:Pyrimidine 5'-nucleotidase n=1 Tax=Edhazardia aedis (strain USNM 41457) TaxID=1003232 RepID=J9DFR1_EDHAE|nr:pyrimidine 5'-nucleotidase [Edhazardia aedis USNM 41457]|eukprot:EJW01440.1 pyrimidine 5'-nucleotidase [Edhazardia aedis USNM 41457]
MTEAHIQVSIPHEQQTVKLEKHDKLKLIPLDPKILSNVNIKKLSSDEKLFIFDIDNTLYKQANGMHENIVELITNYSKSIIDNEKEAVEKVGEYYQSYGVTVKGYLKEHPQKACLKKWAEAFDEKLQIEKYLRPDPDLQEILKNLKNTKNVRLWCLTNSSQNVGYRMLKSLDLLDHFDGMLHCAYNNHGDFMCKPQPQVYEFIVNLFGVKKSENVHVFEDRELNLNAPAKIGWNTHFITVDNHIKKVLTNLMVNL